jgi:hypothetical protein
MSNVRALSALFVAVMLLAAANVEDVGSARPQSVLMRH